MHEPISTPRLTSQGAGGTSGRAPVVEPPTMSKQVTAAIASFSESLAQRDAKLLEVTRVAIAKAYELGFAAGQEELKKQLPAVVRETSFITDDKDRVIGKTEREYKPGGKS